MFLLSAIQEILFSQRESFFQDVYDISVLEPSRRANVCCSVFDGTSLILCFLRSRDYETAYADIIIELEMYDMVDVKKSYDGASNESMNYFHGWLMP